MQAIVFEDNDMPCRLGHTNHLTQSDKRVRQGEETLGAPYQVEATIIERQSCNIGTSETDPVIVFGGCAGSYRQTEVGGTQIHADNLAGALGQPVTIAAIATGNVEHAAIRPERQGRDDRAQLSGP